MSTPTLSRSFEATKPTALFPRNLLSTSDLEAVEADALKIYALAGADVDGPPSVAELCRVLVGSVPSTLPPGTGLLGACAPVTLDDGARRWRIFVAAGLSSEWSRFVVAHELAEWWYRHRGEVVRGDKHEARCDALGARLLCPAIAFDRGATYSAAVIARCFLVPVEIVRRLRSERATRKAGAS